MTKRTGFLAAAILLAVAASAATATAGDAVKSSVSIPSGQPAPIVTENGTPYAQGTYAMGTIQLLYTVNAYQFPVGQFATFDLGLAIQANTQPGTATSYPVNYLALTQTGSSNLVLTPDVAQFSVGDASWSATTPVTISIPPGVPSDDGTTLVGNLQIVAPTGSHLKTTTSVQVKIVLVYPSGGCLKLYDFVTDQDFTQIVTSTLVNVNAKKGTITSTTPYGELSNNVLVVNTCPAPQLFDMRTTLDPWFSVNPVGNPGNAVFVYFATGDVDPSTFNLSLFGTGAKLGQSLQLTGITLPWNNMLLMTVHMSINKGSAAAGLGTAGTFEFQGELFVQGSGFATSLGSIVTPANPAVANVTYTVK